jgi:hypothetical protein
MFSSSARVAEHDLDVAGVRKNRELVLRRIPVLAAVVGARMSVPSRRGSSRSDRRCSLCRWRRRRLWRVSIDRSGMSRDHLCKRVYLCAQRKTKRLCATRDYGDEGVYGFLVGSACLSLGGS